MLLEVFDRDYFTPPSELDLTPEGKARALARNRAMTPSERFNRQTSFMDEIDNIRWAVLRRYYPEATEGELVAERARLLYTGRRDTPPGFLGKAIAHLEEHGTLPRRYLRIGALDS